MLKLYVRVLLVLSPRSLNENVWLLYHNSTRRSCCSVFCGFVLSRCRPGTYGGSFDALPITPRVHVMPSCVHVHSFLCRSAAVPVTLLRCAEFIPSHRIVCVLFSLSLCPPICVVAMLSHSPPFVLLSCLVLSACCSIRLFLSFPPAEFIPRKTFAPLTFGDRVLIVLGAPLKLDGTPAAGLLSRLKKVC